MPKRRALLESPGTRRDVALAPAPGSTASGSNGSGQRFTTVFVTRTQYTTIAWPPTTSSKPTSSSAGHSSPPERSSSAEALSYISSLDSRSSSAPIIYLPTTLSTAITSYSTTTIRTVIYVTSTLTILETPSASTVPTKVATGSASTAQSSSAASTSGGSAGAAEDDHDGSGTNMVSPDGSSRRSAAIAGGMTGGIAGIAMLGLLLLLLFRRRKRRRNDEKSSVVSEPRMSSSSQALPPAIAAAGVTRHSNGSAAIVAPHSQHRQLPIIQDNLIHVNFDHWDRPFAHEDPHQRKTGSPLRLMNPDPTPTPPAPANTSSLSLPPGAAPTPPPHNFLSRQRSALTAALLSVKRSFSSQDVVPRHASNETTTSHTQPHKSLPVPPHNKLTMPSEVILAGATPRPISSHSQASTHTIIRYRVPDDPFVASSPVPPCLQPGGAGGGGVARNDFLMPPPLHVKVPWPLQTRVQPRQQQQHNDVSPLTRSNSDCSTRFESLSSPTRSDVSSVSFRSGPFDLATSSVVGGEGGRGTDNTGAVETVRGQNNALHAIGQNDSAVLNRGQREQTPNWIVHVYPGT